MSSPNSTNHLEQTNDPSPIDNIDDSNHDDDSLPLPPQIPLNYKSKRANNRDHIPNVDSGILFQSNGLLSSNTDLKPVPSLHNTGSSRLPLIEFSKDSNLIYNTGSIEQFNTEKIAEKKQLYPPKINVSSYFNDLFRREIKAPHFKLREELFEFIKPYSIENYAAKYFRKTGFLFFNSQDIQELTTFTNKPLSKPLLEKVPLTKKADVEKLSTYILNYINVIKDQKKTNITNVGVKTSRMV